MTFVAQSKPLQALVDRIHQREPGKQQILEAKVSIAYNEIATVQVTYALTKEDVAALSAEIQSGLA